MFSTTFLILFALSLFFLGSLYALDLAKKQKQEKLVKIPVRNNSLGKLHGKITYFITAFIVLIIK